MQQPFIRPDAEAFLASTSGHRVAIRDIPIPEARAMGLAMRDAFDQPVGDLAVIQDLTADTPAGRIPLRLFDARARRQPGPMMIFLHGGGFWVGSAQVYSPFCAAAARVLDMPVVAVDYRLAPEHPFPAATVDCEAAVRWIASSPKDLGRTATALALCGDSSGGNLAIVTSMALRDRPAERPVIAQFAIYPNTDSRPYPSHEEFADGYGLTKEIKEYAYSLYAPAVLDWRFAPLLGDQTGMPPTLVLTASLDPLRDEGRAYAAALIQAGVPVIFREAKGNIHGFITLAKAIPSSRRDIAGGFAALKGLIAEGVGSDPAHD